jgi:hypothetical protein
MKIQNQNLLKTPIIESKNFDFDVLLKEREKILKTKLENKFSELKSNFFS